MGQRTIREIFIEMLRSELTQTEIDSSVKAELSSEKLQALYGLSKHHDLAHIVSSALHKLGVGRDEAILAKFKKQEMLSVYRAEQMKFSFSEISECLDAEEIPYIPLKGTVIRPYYPRESMRTSSDIDIFIKREDIERTRRALEERLGYAPSGNSFSEVSYLSTSGVHLELHFYDEGDSSSDIAVFERVWEYVEKRKGSQYQLTPAYFLFYHITHMAKHFQHGGCGVRPFMDLWIMQTRMGITRKDKSQALTDNGFDKFADAAYSLMDVWFDGAEPTALTQALQEFIFTGGVYGTTKNASAVAQTKKQSKFGYTMRKIFLPYKQLCFIYPVLKKCPILLPFCQIARWLRILFRKNGAKDAMQKVKAGLSVSEEEKQATEKLFQQLGI